MPCPSAPPLTKSLPPLRLIVAPPVIWHRTRVWSNGDRSSQLAPASISAPVVWLRWKSHADGFASETKKLSSPPEPVYVTDAGAPPTEIDAFWA